MTILILTIELFSYGGIQRFSRQVARAVAGLAERSDQKVRVLSLMDIDQDFEIDFNRGIVDVQVFRGNRFAFIRAAFQLSKEIKKVFVLHPNLAPITFLMRSINPALIYGVHIHGIDAWDRLPFLRRLALQKADFITSTSTYTAEKSAKSNELEVSRIKILHPTLDPLWMEKISQLETSLVKLSKPSSKVILSVARLVSSEQKGIDTVIRAISGLISEFPDLRYILVGSGDDMSRLKSLASELGVQMQVDFKGNVSDEELSEYYKICDLFIMPSKLEGLGIVFLEAMAYSKPVIAGDHGGSSDAVIPGKTGLLVPYGDIAKTQKAITQLLKDEETANEMGRRGKQYLLDNFTFSQFTAKVADILWDNRG